MTEVTIGFGSPVQESGIARLDRSQTATDIGKIAKMLALSSMMLPSDNLFEGNKHLYEFSQYVREITRRKTLGILGNDCLKYENGELIQYFDKAPNELDEYVDAASYTVARLMDGVMASRYYDAKTLKEFKEIFLAIDKIIGEFNSKANSTHKIADITYAERNDEEKTL